MWTQKPRFSHFLKLLAYVTTVHAFTPSFKDKVGFPELRSSPSPETCVQSPPGIACSWLRENAEERALPLNHTIPHVWTFQNKPDIPTHGVATQKERFTIPKPGQKERLAVSITYLMVTSKLHPTPFIPHRNDFYSLAAPQKVRKSLKTRIWNCHLKTFSHLMAWLNFNPWKVLATSLFQF